MILVIGSRHIKDRWIQIFVVVHGIVIFFEHFALVDQTLNHIFGRADYIIVDGTGFVFGIHFFRAFVFFVFDGDTGFFFKLFDYGLIDIFSVI